MSSAGPSALYGPGTWVTAFGDMGDTSSGVQLHDFNICWCCCSCGFLWATRSVVHKSADSPHRAFEIDASEAVDSKVHGEDAILSSRPQRNGLAAEGQADTPWPVLEAGFATHIDPTDMIAWAVLDGRQLFGVRAWAHAIAIGWHRQADGFMGPLSVVDRPPAIEGMLALGEISKTLAGEHFGLERAVKALILALGLRMIGPAMADLDPQPHEPDGEAGMYIAVAVSPWRAIVHEHGSRQAVAAENRHQALACRLVLFVGAGLEPQCIARMVVKNGERMAAAVAGREVALEVHLPQIIGFGMLEAPIRSRMLVTSLIKPAMASQDGGDRARCRHFRCPATAEHVGDLASTPGIVAGRPNAQDLRLHRFNRELENRVEALEKVVQNIKDATWEPGTTLGERS